MKKCKNVSDNNDILNKFVLPFYVGLIAYDHVNKCVPLILKLLFYFNWKALFLLGTLPT